MRHDLRIRVSQLPKFECAFPLDDLSSLPYLPCVGDEKTCTATRLPSRYRESDGDGAHQCYPDMLQRECEWSSFV